MSVHLPCLLKGNLTEKARLHPITGTLNLLSPGVSEAQFTIPPDDIQPQIHDWVEIFTARGSAGIFRVTAISRNYIGETNVTLRHGIDVLSDSVYDDQQEFEGTVTQLLTAILSKQTVKIGNSKMWQLGTVSDETTLKRDLNYNNLYELLASIEEEKTGYYFTYDQTTWPWTLNFVAKPSEAVSEFRLSRNIENIQVSLNDSELCTRLYLSVNVSTTTTPTPDTQNVWPDITVVENTVRQYDNNAAQANWGIVVKTASVDTDDDIEGQGFPSADAWAARYMQDHAEPTLQIQITGEELKALTGDSFDEAKIGTICRVTLPDYNALFTQRIVAVSYPDLYGAPDQVNVSLANRLPRVSSSIAKQKQESAKTSETAKTALRKSGGGGGGAGAAKELQSWAQICKYVKESEDSTGITELRESGIVVDAETGTTIYSVKQGFVSQQAQINVSSDKISMVVSGTTPGSYAIKAASICLAIRDAGSEAWISADKIYLNGQTSVNALLTGAAAIGSMRVTSLTVGGYGCSWMRIEADNGIFYALCTYD